MGEKGAAGDGRADVAVVVGNVAERLDLLFRQAQLVLGVERKLFFFLLTSCFGLFVVMSALLPSLILFVLLWSGAKLAPVLSARF